MIADAFAISSIAVCFSYQYISSRKNPVCPYVNSPFCINKRRTMNQNLPEKVGGEILLYQAEDGQTRLEVRMNKETVWLSQNQMAILFQTTKQNVSLHIKNVFSEGELSEDSVVKDFLTTASDGKNYQTRYYNLDVIISVGYRVKSLRGTQFRIWATQRLREYIVKGFTLDDDRLSPAAAAVILTSCSRVSAIFVLRKKFFTKRFWEFTPPVLITTPAPKPQGNSLPPCRTRCTGRFTARLPLKSLPRGRTLPSLIWDSPTGKAPAYAATTAKNYLTQEELDALNLIVSAYLDFAELQALNRRAMHMADWTSA